MRGLFALGESYPQLRATANFADLHRTLVEIEDTIQNARRYHNAVVRDLETPDMFEKFLPYAMALGVEENWAQAFEGIAQQPPQWYTGPGGLHNFHARSFTSSLGRMSAQAATVMASAPRSSGGSGFGGGGRSGGGFGGGGGGGF